MAIGYQVRATRSFHALSDPTRRGILEQLAGGERTVNELVEQFTISQPAITKHLGVLESAGLISRRKEGRQRFCKLESAGMEPAAEWIAKWSRFWNARLDRLEEYPGGRLLEAGDPEPELG